MDVGSGSLVSQGVLFKCKLHCVCGFKHRRKVAAAGIVQFPFGLEKRPGIGLSKGSRSLPSILALVDDGLTGNWVQEAAPLERVERERR